MPVPEQLPIKDPQKFNILNALTKKNEYQMEKEDHRKGSKSKEEAESELNNLATCTPTPCSSEFLQLDESGNFHINNEDVQQTDNPVNENQTGCYTGTPPTLFHKSKNFSIKKGEFNAYYTTQFTGSCTILLISYHGLRIMQEFLETSVTNSHSVPHEEN
ncbi:hypothetical protein C8R42DRAFT_647383 [Lentinula raphanica]|nr:hypothetical protein C8R42DRAFT_647383 [Lentinula raphanica]